MTKYSEKSSCPLSMDEIRRKVEDLGDWFHNLDLRGVQTAPSHFLGDYPSWKWRKFSHTIPSNLRGKTVLDIGCNAGFYSLEMKKRGADRVVGIDCDNSYLAQARFAAQVHNLDIEFREMSVFDASDLGEKFDIVLFMGIFYHLRYPLLALDIIHRHAARDVLIFQSMLRGSMHIEEIEPDYPFPETEIFSRPGFPRMHFIENSYSNDLTNWWIPNKACVEALLRSAGFAIIANPEEEVFTCRRVEKPGWIEEALPLRERRGNEFSSKG